MIRNLAKRFYRYCTKTYHIDQGLSRVSCSRIGSSVSTRTILATVFTSFATGLPSVNQIDEAVSKGEFRKVFPKGEQLPSARTIYNCFDGIDLRALERANADLIQQARYKKVFAHGTIDGYLVAGFDGSEVYNTYYEESGCEHWSRRMITRKVDGVEKKMVQYYQRVAVASYVGKHPRLVLGIRREEKGKGEVDTAIQLLRRLCELNNRFCDIITLDSLYAKAPFINEALSHNKDVIIWVKQENYHIIRDAEGLFSQRPPDVVEENLTLKDEDNPNRHNRILYDVKIWDEDGFESWNGVNEPLRCLKIVQVRKAISAKGEEISSEEKSVYIVSTCPKETVKAITVWRIAHRRWDMENSGFNVLKSQWHLEHCFTHDPTGMTAFMLLMIMAMNMLLLFLDRNLKTYKPGKSTMIGQRRRLSKALETLGQPVWPRAPT